MTSSALSSALKTLEKIEKQGRGKRVKDLLKDPESDYDGNWYMAPLPEVGPLRRNDFEEWINLSTPQFPLLTPSRGGIARRVRYRQSGRCDWTRDPDTTRIKPRTRHAGRDEPARIRVRTIAADRTGIGIGQALVQKADTPPADAPDAIEPERRALNGTAVSRGPTSRSAAM